MRVEIVSKSSKLACIVVVDEILTKNEEDEEGIITIPILNKSNCKSLKTEKPIYKLIKLVLI